MRRLIEKFLGARSASAQATLSPRSRQVVSLPDLSGLVYAVGDVHGCAAEYRMLEAKIVQDAGSSSGSVTVILLGDLVDRGPETASLLDLFTSPAPIGVNRLAICGNHEEKMLAFLSEPGKHRNWLDWGGTETLASYGVTPDPVQGYDQPNKRLRHLIDAHIPSEHIRFLQELPIAVHMGEYFFCHAGIDPSRPLDNQLPSDLLWRRENLDDPPENVTVIHGHTPVSEVRPQDRYINVDTGAYATGILSAVRLSRHAPPKVLSVP